MERLYVTDLNEDVLPAVLLHPPRMRDRFLSAPEDFNRQLLLTTKPKKRIHRRPRTAVRASTSSPRVFSFDSEAMDSSPPQMPPPLSPSGCSAGAEPEEKASAGAIEDSSSTASTHRSRRGKSQRKRRGKSSYQRSGKWSSAEENYAKCMILHYSKGLLQLRSGETLRHHMSKKLFCDPMRITKRFAGTGALMKEISQSRQHCGSIELAVAKSQLDALEKDFLEEVEAEQEAVLWKSNGSTAVKLSASSSTSSDSTQSSVASVVNEKTPSPPCQGAPETLLQQNHHPTNISGATISSSALDASGVSALLLQILAAQSQTAPPQQATQSPNQGVDPALLLAILAHFASPQPSASPSICFPPASNSANPVLLAALGSLRGFQQQQQPFVAPVNPLIQLLQQQQLVSQQQQQQQSTGIQQPAPANTQAVVDNLAQLMGSSPAPAPEPQDAHLFLNFVNSCARSRAS